MGPRNKLAKITGGFLSIFYCCKLKDGTVGPKMPSVTDDVTFRSKFCEFDSCALSRKASRHKRFAKIPSLQLIYVIGLFRSLHKMHDHRWGSEQIMFENWQPCGGWMIPFCDHGKIQFTQYCLYVTNPCIVSLFCFPPHWMNTFPRNLNFSTCCRLLLVTFRMHWPEFMERCNTSVFSVLISFQLYWTQQKTD